MSNTNPILRLFREPLGKLPKRLQQCTLGRWRLSFSEFAFLEQVGERGNCIASKIFERRAVSNTSQSVQSRNPDRFVLVLDSQSLQCRSRLIRSLKFEYSYPC